MATPTTEGATTGQISALNRITPHEQVQWRGDRATRDGSRIAVLAYVDARYVADVLDETVGAQNWQDRYEDPPGGTRCGIGIYVEGQWVWKWDAAPQTDIEAIKGAHSDSFKRAGVKWGIARDLYDYPDLWVPAEETYAGSGKYKPAILPTWNGTTWVVDNHTGRGPSSPRPQAAPAGRPPRPAAPPPDDDILAPDEDVLPFRPFPVAKPGDTCEEHGVEWRGEVGDLYHGPKPWHRHEGNTKRARR